MQSGAIKTCHAAPASGPGAGRPPKLLDRLREALRARQYSRRSEHTCIMWVRRYLYFHNSRRPVQMREAEINTFLTHWPVRDKASASARTQALSALVILYRHVPGREVGGVRDVICARKPKRLPIVMARDEVEAILGAIEGDKENSQTRSKNGRERESFI